MSHETDWGYWIELDRQHEIKHCLKLGFDLDEVWIFYKEKAE